MDTSDQLTWRIWQAEGMGRGLLIGGLLFYIPIANLLLLGYWGLWIRCVEERRAEALPDWTDWRAIVEETGRLLPIFLGVVVLPLLGAGGLVWMLQAVLDWVSLDLFATSLAWAPMAAVALLAGPACCLAILRRNRTDSLAQALDVRVLSRVVLARYRRWLPPVLQFFGLALVGWPVLGFAVFLGMAAVLGHLVLVFKPSESRSPAPAI